MSDRREPETESKLDLRVARLLQAVAVAWLFTLVWPAGALLGPDPTAMAVAAMSAVAIFVVTYLWIVYQIAPFGGPLGPATDAFPRSPSSRESAALARWLPIGILIVVDAVLIPVDGSAWLALIIFTCVAIAFRLRTREVAWALLAMVPLATGLGIAAGASARDVGQACFIGLSVGAGVGSVFYAFGTVRELRVARGELARLAVAEERLRFARDLHDLLGHSLSLIALKSELAGQLVGQAPGRAADEMRDVEGVARTALREVREAVAGYRQPTLASELAAAAEILAAAGITFCSAGEPGPLPPRVEATLAWTVREGVTNVIRHSRAHSCFVRFTADADRIAVEVTDDGNGAPDDSARPSPATSGGRNGLTGLAERVVSVGGAIESGPLPTRGYRLSVNVPRGPTSRNPATPVEPDIAPMMMEEKS